MSIKNPSLFHEWFFSNEMINFHFVIFFVFRFRSKEIAAASAKDCRQSEIKYIEGATHWVNQECPEQVNNYIHEFLRAWLRCFSQDRYLKVYLKDFAGYLISLFSQFFFKFRKIDKYLRALFKVVPYQKC